MQITGCKFFLIETQRETGAISEHLMVRIDTDAGLSGWGEWSDLSHIHPGADFPHFDQLEEEANFRIKGADPLNISATMARLDGILAPAFDIGLHDLLGKALDVPVYVLLGGKRRDRIPFCYPIFPMATPDTEDPTREVNDNLRRVRRVVDLGQNRIRKYIGYNVESEAAWLERFQAEFGGVVDIKSFDLSGRFHWQDALAILRRFMDYGYELAESVSKRSRERVRWTSNYAARVNTTDVKGMAELRRQLGKPISEHLNTEEDLLLYKEHEAVDLANIAVCGNGIARAKYLFDFAHSIGLGTLHGTTQELSIGTAAAAHVMASLDSIDAPCDPAGPLLYQQDCAKKRVLYEDSHLIVPEGPGLGIKVDEDLLEAQAYTGARLRQLRSSGVSAGH